MAEQCKCIISYVPGYGLCCGSSGAVMIDFIPSLQPLPRDILENYSCPPTIIYYHWGYKYQRAGPRAGDYSFKNRDLLNRTLAENVSLLANFPVAAVKIL